MSEILPNVADELLNDRTIPYDTKTFVLVIPRYSNSFANFLQFGLSANTYTRPTWTSDFMAQWKQAFPGPGMWTTRLRIYKFNYSTVLLYLFGDGQQSYVSLHVIKRVRSKNQKKNYFDLSNVLPAKQSNKSFADINLKFFDWVPGAADEISAYNSTFRRANEFCVPSLMASKLIKFTDWPGFDKNYTLGVSDYKNDDDDNEDGYKNGRYFKSKACCVKYFTEKLRMPMNKYANQFLNNNSNNSNNSNSNKKPSYWYENFKLSTSDPERYCAMGRTFNGNNIKKYRYNSFYDYYIKNSNSNSNVATNTNPIVQSVRNQNATNQNATNQNPKNKTAKNKTAKNKTAKNSPKQNRKWGFRKRHK